MVKTIKTIGFPRNNVVFTKSSYWWLDRVKKKKKNFFKNQTKTIENPIYCSQDIELLLSQAFVWYSMFEGAQAHLDGPRKLFSWAHSTIQMNQSTPTTIQSIFLPFLCVVTSGLVVYELYRFNKCKRNETKTKEISSTNTAPPASSGVISLIGNTPMIEIVSLSKATGI